MAYNKSKYVEAAQKLLNQGKVPQAIAEYKSILKYEPNDQVTLMTVGELYIRQGETNNAMEFFERLAQVFVNDGFLTKAIAAYKRIVRLAPEEVRPLEKLAELYVQQGVMSEARPIFLQLAELHLKNNRQIEAVALLKKLLAAEPDNLRIQIRLADLHQALGQSEEAEQAYVEAAQRALARGEYAESEKLAEKALKIQPQSAGALTIRARSFAAQNRTQEAIQQLQKLPDIANGGEHADFLLELYLKNSNWNKAAELAQSFFQANPKNYAPMQKAAEAMLAAREFDSAKSLIGSLREPLFAAGESEPVIKLLSDLAAQLPDETEPQEWLVDAFQRISDPYRLTDAQLQLGDALVNSGHLDRGKELFEQILKAQPDHDNARQKLNALLRSSGQGGAVVPDNAPAQAEEFFVTDLAKQDAPRVFRGDEEEKPPSSSPADGEDALDPETERFVTQSLTDVDLFASYGLTQKAISLLDAVLKRAPRHTGTIEKMLDFVVGSGDNRRTAELAGSLEQIYADRNDTRNSARFGEMRRRYQRAAGLSDEDVMPAPSPVPAAAVPPSPPPPPVQVTPVAPQAPPPPPPPPVAAPPVIPAVAAIPAAPVELSLPVEIPQEAPAMQSAVHEVDLSAEWTSAVEEAPAAQPEPEPQELSLDVKVVEEAAAPPPPPPPPPPVRAAKPAPPPPAPEPEPEELSLDVEIVEEAAAPPPPPPAPPKARPASGTEPLPKTARPSKPAPPKKEQVPATAASAADLTSDDFLAELASELDHLGLGEMQPKPSQPAQAAPKKPEPPKPPKPAPAAAPVGGNAALQEVFDEFRAELGEMESEDEEEDIETHYSLGIAFREMGLLEEAISEFQKVAKAHDRGRAFRYAMQCCTLLGLAFMEKNQPAIAAHWYERALQTPDLDQESTLALRYDLGVAQESAGDLDAALKSFSLVYAANIDYRDVAERISTLQKSAR
ncbi:MAG: tetratricopeptide repeat protein [Acidobacteriia bacterium]|nr:tetratricopeptide repeat protein [Terriglobia bacterium]